MMTFLFLMIALVITLIWLGYRKGALTSFILTMLFSVIWLFHHASSHLNLQF